VEGGGGDGPGDEATVGHSDVAPPVAPEATVATPVGPREEATVGTPVGPEEPTVETPGEATGEVPGLGEAPGEAKIEAPGLGVAPGVATVGVVVGQVTTLAQADVLVKHDRAPWLLRHCWQLGAAA